MGNNNLMLTEMFEEIKSLLVSIEKKLDTEASKSSRSNPEIELRPQNTQPKVDFQKLDQIFKAIYAYLQNSDYKTSETTQSIRESENRILSQLQEIKYSIDTQEKERIVRHQYSIDMKSSKVVLTIISLSFFLLLSMSANINQLITISKMRDIDLKHQYIKSQNGINSEKLKKPKKTFEYPKDNKK